MVVGVPCSLTVKAYQQVGIKESMKEITSAVNKPVLKNSIFQYLFSTSLISRQLQASERLHWGSIQKFLLTPQQHVDRDCNYATRKQN
ncbi:hypothetical protein TNCV_310661 [Trichonephila clavipes]|nr:hypothetical protein TNCV_310661 [Trichonephila clavipes]